MNTLLSSLLLLAVIVGAATGYRSLSVGQPARLLHFLRLHLAVRARLAFAVTGFTSSGPSNLTSSSAPSVRFSR